MTAKPLIIPPQFWGTLTMAEAAELFSTGELNAELCARVWHMTDRQGPPPQGGVKVWVKKAELERMLKKWKRQGKP
jgi:hypothetical protein